MLFRTATAADAPAVAAIYAREVETGYASFDTAAPDAGYWRGRITEAGAGLHFLVAEDAGAIAGFAYSSIYRPRGAYARTRESTVYLTPAAQGQGVGRALYAELLDRVRADGMHTVLAVVALPNPASAALHRASGFEPVGTFAEVGHKLGAWRDVQFWQLMLDAGD